MMLLSNIMPELTETQLRHRGVYTVENYDNSLGVIVGSVYMSVDAYIELNGLPKTVEYRDTIFRNLGVNGVHSDLTNTGHYVRIIANWYKGYN